MHLLFALIVVSQTIPSDALIRGAAVRTGDHFYTWGEGAYEWHGSKAVRWADGWFGEGGCLIDVDRDGHDDLVLQKGNGLGDLVWISGAQSHAVRKIDAGVSMHDCIATDLLGHKGILMVQRGMQVRFYEPPAKPSGEWGYQELYSFYTPSRQAMLLRADVDGDGLVDILCGNYWIKSPPSFELPWRLVAINTYSETEDSSTVRMVQLNGGVLIAQSHMKDARLALFSKPNDLTHDRWGEKKISENLHFPHGLVRFRDGALVAEHNGPGSRVFYVHDSRLEETGVKFDAVALLESGDDVLAVGPHQIQRWRK